MTARRTSKKKPLRSASGEKYPDAVAGGQAQPTAEDAPDATAPVADGADEQAEAAGMVEERLALDIDGEAKATDEDNASSEGDASDEALAAEVAEPPAAPEASPIPALADIAAAEARTASDAPVEAPTARGAKQPSEEPMSGAEAEGFVFMQPSAQQALLAGEGSVDALAAARIAGVTAAKHASDIVPLRQALPLASCSIDIRTFEGDQLGRESGAPAESARAGFRVSASCAVAGAVGSEVEALAAVSASCLSLFDACIALDPAAEISSIRLLAASLGAETVWTRAGAENHALEQAGAEVEPAAQPAPEPERASLLPGGPGTGKAAPAVAFVGYQNAGKTTLVERVIARLSQRGLRVGSIKLHDTLGFDIDAPGKDSWRHAQAGSRHVGIIAGEQVAEYADTEGPVDVADLLARFTDVDVVVVEGFQATGLPSIVVARSGVDRMRGTDSFDLIDENTLAVACNENVARDFRSRAIEAARERAEAAGEPFSPRGALPPTLGINDVPAIVNFIMAYLQELSTQKSEG